MRRSPCRRPYLDTCARCHRRLLPDASACCSPLPRTSLPAAMTTLREALTAVLGGVEDLQFLTDVLRVRTQPAAGPPTCASLCPAAKVACQQQRVNKPSSPLFSRCLHSTLGYFQSSPPCFSLLCPAVQQYREVRKVRRGSGRLATALPDGSNLACQQCAACALSQIVQPADPCVSPLSPLQAAAPATPPPPSPPQTPTPPPPPTHPPTRLPCFPKCKCPFSRRCTTTSTARKTRRRCRRAPPTCAPSPTPSCRAALCTGGWASW